jgi:hypothetical protein
MNNTDLTEKLCLHIIRNSNPLNEEVYERTLYGGPWQFIKDSAKTLLQIRRLKPDDEIILDTIEPVGFLSILRNTDETYTLTLVFKGKPSKSYHVDKATTVMKRVVDLLKDQMTTGRKNLKAQYK